MSEELHRCECGGRADLWQSSKSVSAYFWIACRKCGFQTTYGGIEFVLKIWNKAKQIILKNGIVCTQKEIDSFGGRTV